MNKRHDRQPGQGRSGRRRTSSNSSIPPHSNPVNSVPDKAALVGGSRLNGMERLTRFGCTCREGWLRVRRASAGWHPSCTNARCAFLARWRRLQPWEASA